MENVTITKGKCLKSKAFFLVFLFSLSSLATPVRIALSSVPNNLSPFFSTDGNSQNIGRLLFTSLVDLGPDMKFKCLLCESFKESFKNGKHFIHFKIKKNQTFWDGTTIGVKEIKDSIDYFRSEDPRIKSVFRFAFNKIKNVMIESDSEITLVYDKFRLENLGNLPLLKIIKFKKSFDSYPSKTRILFSQIIGSGQYQLTKQDPFSIGLKRVDNSGSPLVFKIVKDETTLALKLKNKEIDLSVADMSVRKLNWLKENSDHLDFPSQPSTIYRYINVNHQREIFQNPQIRKALSLLIPREKILKNKLKGLADLSTSMFSTAFSELQLGKKFDSYNPKEAEKILDKEGYPRKKNGVRFSLDWKSTNNKTILELVYIFKSFFEKAGIQVNVTGQEWGTFMKSIKTGKFDIYTSQWIGFTGPDMLSYVFHSKNFAPKGGNRGFYQNKRLNEILDRAEIEINPLKRTELYKKALALIYRERPYIDLWHPYVSWIHRDCIKIGNLYPNASFYPLVNLENNCL